MKLKTLESTLSNVEPFRDPKLDLEQYLTSPHIAGHMLYHIEMKFGDIEGKTVVDLGCGTGMLSIAASLMGASYCLGLDIDDDALSIARENLDDGEITNVDLLKVDVIEKRFRRLNVRVEPVTQIKFDLPRSYKNHRRESLDIEVQMLRFSRIDG
ncbi:hypothetical protein HELRODRAFT_157302 [Helobdella robusta]|uniref:Methyltransferase domain-containing protein n=1 Tax=Helobdella robusta TaxID=6412 RepID=T1EM91_HELRO|nr:hypothetical protein HELRODRAFT_157302 [Helobdella robusta]ESO00869.1 hypothetical protein HELRODRAFT_157302 [Helobdella robusta]